MAATPGPFATPTSLEPLLDDPYPLARLHRRFARSSARESRGAHRRSDFRLPDGALDGVHLVLDADRRAAAGALGLSTTGYQR